MGGRETGASLQEEHLKVSRFSKSWLIFCNLLDGKEPVAKNKDQLIDEIKVKMDALGARDFVTANSKIGRGDNLEAFPMRHLNICRNPELMACPRRPPKKTWSWVNIKNTLKIIVGINLFIQNLILILFIIGLPS
jgi:hypothetical protein